jgi:hypothetical protein
MDGRIDAEVDSSPVSLVAEQNRLVLRVTEWRALLHLRRIPPSAIQPLKRFLTEHSVSLSIQISWLRKIEVFPAPSYLVSRWLPAAWR